MTGRLSLSAPRRLQQIEEAVRHSQEVQRDRVTEDLLARMHVSWARGDAEWQRDVAITEAVQWLAAQDGYIPAGAQEALLPRVHF